MGDKTMKTRYVISDTTPEGYAVRFETSADGKEWKSLMEGQVTKAKPPAREPRRRPEAAVPEGRGLPRPATGAMTADGRIARTAQGPPLATRGST